MKEISVQELKDKKDKGEDFPVGSTFAKILNTENVKPWRHADPAGRHFDRIGKD